MQRFFVEPEQIGEDMICITGEDVNHIQNVLRMRSGEEISVMVSGEEREYRCEIGFFTGESVMCPIRFIKDADMELPCEVYLFQGLPKDQKMELIIQKSVELGVHEVIPVSMTRSVVKLDAAKGEKKVTRWQGISEAAAKQSKRGIVPNIHGVMTFREAVSYCGEFDVKLIPYEMADPESMAKTRKILSNIPAGSKIAVFIGPEGGITPEELDEAQANGVVPITLGRRILRTETAPLVVMSWLVYELER